VVIGNHLYVADGDNSVTVIDTDTNTATATINVGTQPGWMALKGNRFYVSSAGGNAVHVINTDDNTVVDTDGSIFGIQPVLVGKNPWGWPPSWPTRCTSSISLTIQ
jgi:YVTN family beta-propeller protein